MNVKDLTRQAITAALYAVICIALAPISFGAVQFRMAEMMMVLPFYNKKYIIGLTLGCLITNMFSPLGMADVIFGTMSTLITCILVSRMKKMRYIAPVTAIVTGLIIGTELYAVLGLPFLPSVISVAAGEFGVVLVGVAGAKVLVRNRVNAV